MRNCVGFRYRCCESIIWWCVCLKIFVKLLYFQSIQLSCVNSNIIDVSLSILWDRLTCVMINKVIVTMIDGNPNIPHKRTACRRIFNLTGSLDSEEFLSAMSGLFISSNWRLVTPVITHVLVYTRHSLYFRNYRAYWGKQNIIYMELFEMGRQT